MEWLGSFGGIDLIPFSGHLQKWPTLKHVRKVRLGEVLKSSSEWDKRMRFIITQP